MKYNTKIKNLFFFGLVAIIFCLPIGKVLAGTIVCGDVNRLGLGECEYGECSEGYSKDFNGSYDCQDNWFDKTCCVLSSGGVAKSTTSTLTPDSSDSFATTSYDCWDKNDPTIGGNCQMTSCPSGSKTLTGGCEDNWFQKTCCRVDDGSGTTAISASGLSGLSQNSANTSNANTNVNSPSVSNNSSSAYTGGGTVLPSQCSGGQTGGVQDGCSDVTDSAVLAQCARIYSGEPTVCATKQSYLNKMTEECTALQALNPPAATNINCATIAQGGIYGREASKFSNYLMGGSSGGASGGSSGSSAGGLDFDSIAALGVPDNAGGVKGVLTNIVKWMLGIITLITFIAFIISGGQYLMASGDDKMIETAKKNMTYSVIGIIVALSGFIVIRAVDAALRATNGLF